MRYLILLILFVSVSLSSELINVNFKNLEIKELIKITSQNIKKNVLITQDIKGKVDFISNEPITKDNLLNILKYSLEANGYKLIEKNNILKIVKNDFKEEVNKKSSTIPVQIVKYINSETKNLSTSHTEIILLKNIDYGLLVRLDQAGPFP